MEGVGRLEFIYASKTVKCIVPTDFSDLSNGFKSRKNEFKLRRHNITNKNTFRRSVRADVTEKTKKNCKFHYFSAFKTTDVDKRSVNVRNLFDSDLF